MANDTYPLQAYRYIVSIDNVNYGFSEVSGLESSHEVISQINSKGSIDYSIGEIEPVRLLLKKGVVISPKSSRNLLYYWYRLARSSATASRKNILVSLIDAAENPLISWLVSEAIPTRYVAPQFNADINALAIEVLELTGRDLIIEYEAEI